MKYVIATLTALALIFLPSCRWDRQSISEADAPDTVPEITEKTGCGGDAELQPDGTYFCVRQ